jgi:hypothetical protein
MLTLSGCINLTQEKVTPSQKKKIHITKLNKEVKKLDSHDKRLIYKSIKNEIKLHKMKGDEDYKNGYYYDAIKAYELVNFYESYNAVSPRKIKAMKLIAKKRAYQHYKKAKYYIRRSDKKRALTELNSVMMNNPEYKNSKLLYNNIKNIRDIKIYLNKLQTTLETKLVNSKQTYKELKSIQNSLNKLAKYDYKNSSLQKARDLLRDEKKSLLNHAITLYKAKKFKRSKETFNELLALYPHDPTSKKYIAKIKFKQSKNHNLHLAKESLSQDHYLEAITYAKQVLELETTNKEAKQLIQKAKQKADEAVMQYVKNGKKAYNNKQLDLAKKYFEAALAIDKTNNTSLIYHKKIQQQLQTIESLQ